MNLESLNLEEIGLVQLNSTETEETEGGLLWLVFMAAGWVSVGSIGALCIAAGVANGYNHP